jgi:flagellar basal-body rod protein FlgB
VTSIIDSSTVGLVSLALDAAVMRQQAIAQNIANANTPGYQRVGVSFENRLSELKNAVLQGHALPSGGLAAYRPSLTVEDDAGEPVQLDMEVAALSDNVLHHQALLKVLNKHMALIDTAINEGKK